MKKIIIAVCSLIITLLLVLIGVSLLNKQEEGQMESKFNEIEEVKYDEILSKEGKQIYYYYQPTCGYCNKLKPTIVEFYEALEKSKSDVSFNKIDMSKEENFNAWYDWEAHKEKFGDLSSDAKDNPDYKFEPKDLVSVEDLKISGTPSLVYVEDGKIKEFKVGNDDIAIVLDNIAKNNQIDFTSK